MGQKVNPQILRLGTIYNWNSRWFDDKRYKDILFEDFILRKTLMDRLRPAGVARIEIERSINSLRVSAYVSRPGMVIGRAGTGMEDLQKFVVSKLTKVKGKLAKNTPKIDIRIEQIKEPNLDAYLVARNIAEQLIKRLPAKRVLAQTGDKVMGAGAKGVRIVLGGRIGGAEIARREKIQLGTVPLSTIRARIQFASFPAATKMGYVGIKVWINKPEEKNV